MAPEAPQLQQGLADLIDQALLPSESTTINSLSTVPKFQLDPNTDLSNYNVTASSEISEALRTPIVEAVKLPQDNVLAFATGNKPVEYAQLGGSVSEVTKGLVTAELSAAISANAASYVSSRLAADGLSPKAKALFMEQTIDEIFDRVPSRAVSIQIGTDTFQEQILSTIKGIVEKKIGELSGFKHDWHLDGVSIKRGPLAQIGELATEFKSAA